MKASVVDLRYKMNDVLKALDRNEEVSILYHGKVKGIITSSSKKSNRLVSDHPFFKMSKSIRSVKNEMARLRGERHHAV